jgi:RNA polymerase sigma factor (sigma-70 family)
MRESWTGDVELVLAARTGDINALGLLLQLHRARLYAGAVAHLRDREAAADAVQDTFLVAMTRLHTLRDPAAVLPWLQQIVRNCALMQQRRHRHEVIVSDLDNTDTSPSPEQLLDDNALRDSIWTALEELPEEERVCLVLRHFTRSQSYHAIAGMTGTPVGTVRSRLHRARHHLVEALVTNDGGPHRDQTRLEKSRLEEWKAFYQLLHETPEPRTYRDLYHPDVMVRDDRARWRGIHSWSAEERAAINLGVRATITGLVAGPDLTVLEIDFLNPPSAPGHCPPATTFVHHLHRGQTARLDIAYHVS